MSYKCETDKPISHSPACSDEEFSEMLHKARKIGRHLDIVCKSCFKEIEEEKKIIYKSKNLYVIQVLV